MKALKIVHIVMDTAHGPLSLSDVRAGGRGVTGSEQAMLFLAQAQADAGHIVSCYLPTDTPQITGTLDLMDVRRAYPRFRRMDDADVVISWLSADALRRLPSSTLRVHSIQINDWMLCADEYEKYVDVFVCVSHAHREALWAQPGHPGTSAAVEIIPNGVEMRRFEQTETRIPHRLVYVSSPDRGLHWLLSIWPEIRFAFPDAELHVFYEVKKWLEGAILLNSDVGIRAKYAMRRFEDLRAHGLFVHGAIAPDALASELLRADVLVYPCDPVRFTEGFGVAVLEACAAGAVPIITDADALGEVYGASGAVVVPRAPGRQWLDQYLEMVLKLLRNPQEIEERRKAVQQFARVYDWSLMAQRWDQMITQRKSATQR